MLWTATSLYEKKEVRVNGKGWKEIGREGNPYPWYRAMCSQHPVRFHDEIWEVYRYRDVERVLSDHEAFSSARLVTETQEEERQSLLTSDPPYHRQLRSLVQLAFTPRLVTQLESRIEEIVQELLDQVMGQGEMDIIEDLAQPLPTQVIAELIGVPTVDRKRIHQWSRQRAQHLLQASKEEKRQVQQEMDAYLSELIACPHGLIQALQQAKIEGRLLSERELLNFCTLLLSAGSETFTHLLGNCFLCLSREDWRHLALQPALLPGAIEEVLRFLPPLQWVARVCQKEAVVHGQEIKKGQLVLCCVAAANRDDEQFPDPDTFNIRRQPNRHLSLGHGIHFCLGASLARLEAQVALRVLLHRCEWTLKSSVLERAPLPLFYGVKQFPVFLTEVPNA